MPTAFRHDFDAGNGDAVSRTTDTDTTDTGASDADTTDTGASDTSQIDATEDMRPADAAAADADGDRAPGDSSPDSDSSVTDGALDAAADSEVETSQPDVAPPRDRVLLRGQMEGRGGYSASGTVELIALAEGGHILRLGADFSVGSVPGPVVALSTRASIGSRLDEGAGDILLDVLARNSGEQSYPAPAVGANAGYAWIYCQPFGVEIGRAVLEEVTE